jgi:phage tail sheath gpL-like
MSGSLLAGAPPPQTITFAQIPAGLQVPGNYTEIAANNAAVGLLTYPARVLILAPISAAGTIIPQVPVQIFTPQQSDGLFGAGSVGAAMCRAFVAANPWTPLWAMGLPNATTTTAATWTIPLAFAHALTGSPGTLNLYVGGVQIPVSVVPGVDTATTIASNLLAAINATANLPVTASLSGATITLTARDMGALGNLLPVGFAIRTGDTVPGGQTAGVNNLTATVTNNLAGTGTPVVANGFLAIAATWFTHFVIPWTDSTTATAVSAELTRRWSAMTKLDARAFSFTSQSTLTALTGVAGAAAINSQFWSIGGLQNEPTAPWVVAATYAAVAVFNLLNDPARQLKTLLLPGVVAPASPDILTEPEQQALVTNGLALFNANNDGTVSILRAASTYQQAPGGIPDTTWLDITTAETLARIRYDWNAYLGLVYPRNKLAADGTTAAEYDPAVATPRRLHTSWTARCRLYEQLGWIQKAKATAAASVFELDASNPNQMDTQLQLLLVNNLMITANQIIFSLLPAPASPAAA